MSLATAKNGDRLLEFHKGESLDLPESIRSIPLPLALVAPRHQGKTLFIYNMRRNCWELHGGMIDAGETPHDAAIRELAEESGQIVSAVQYVGWLKFQLMPDNRLELGVLYTCELDSMTPFVANNEASKMMMWDMKRPVVDYVNEIDLYLANLVQ